MRAAPGSMPARRLRPTRGARDRVTLESVAAEFALLAQRRARLQRQLDLIERQRIAAAGNLFRVEQRMMTLSGQMTVTVPRTLSAAAAPPPAPPSPAPTRTRRGAVLEY